MTGYTGNRRPWTRPSRNSGTVSGATYWNRRGGQRGGRGRSGCRAAGRSAGNLEHLTWEDHVRVMHHGPVGLVEQAPIGRVAVKPLRYGGQRVARSTVERRAGS